MRARHLLLTLACALTCALAPGAGTAAGSDAATAPPPPEVPTLVAIRAAHHPGFDRIVFEFDGTAPEAKVRYVDRLFADGSGLPVRVPGRAILRVRFEPADAHDDSGAVTAPRRRAYDLPNLVTAVRAGDFEAVTTYGLGLAKRTRFEVTTLTDPSRVVVDVRAAFRTVARRVFFLDVDRFRDNVEPFFVGRTRSVRPLTPATGLLDRLYAGPLVPERADGLRLVRSGTTGFSSVVVQAGVAHVRLTGRCSSGGSTVTVAGSIMPTLRRLPGVRWVKIYDSAGTTEQPTGRSDSIPECLEP